VNALLVYPRYPETFWSFTYALRFVSRKASHPPLGLLTVAALLPGDWSKLLVDLNVRPLTDRDLAWADIVFLGGMSIQKESAESVIDQCRRANKPIVAGGPLFTALHDEIKPVDHLVLNEAELTLPPFLTDLKAGRPRPIYNSSEFADVTRTPTPLWHLLEKKHYASMNMQYSRGCPYDCDFCDITVLYGRIPRTKSADQVVAELDSLYRWRWRGNVFFVDDNFIGNKKKLKNEILPAIREWMDRRKHPFTLNTEASINLADDEELMHLMVRAGFDTVFVGIESPNDESLEECHKSHNRNRDLLGSVRKIHGCGLEVQGGFIVGFDKDPASIFDTLARFVQESGIVTAMVGLLNAPKGTKLYKRLMSEGRLLKSMSGDNTDASLNFIPTMNLDKLMEGYRHVIKSIYTPEKYYERVRTFLREYKPVKRPMGRLRMPHLKALVKSMVVLGMIGKERVEYWKLFCWSLFRKPRMFPLAITFAIYGFHFRKVFEHCM